MTRLHYLHGNLSEPDQDAFERESIGKPFTTIDRDNDRNKDFNCAEQFEKGYA